MRRNFGGAPEEQASVSRPQVLIEESLDGGEAREAGLARELLEELGITIAAPRPLIRVRHAYPTREVLLDMWVVTRYRGEPRGLDGQALRWCAQDDLATAKLLPADKPIVVALRLPERLRDVLCSSTAMGVSGVNEVNE